MADKPSATPPSGGSPAASSRDHSSPNGSLSEVEIRLRSTERVKLVLKRCGRCSAPGHLLVRIRETLIAITTTDSGTP
jgi:hypothetical protein